MPDICPNNYSCVLTAHERKRDNIIIPVRIRTYKIMPLVLKLGKSSYPLPPEKNLERPPRASECTNRAETYIVDQCVRPGFSRPSTSCFAEKCWYEEKSWQKYEKLTNVRIHLYLSTFLSGGYQHEPGAVFVKKYARLLSFLLNKCGINGSGDVFVCVLFVGT